MKRIEEKMLTAIRKGKEWKLGNTEVCRGSFGIGFDVYLHGNLIAKISDDGSVEGFSLRGWNTVTTRSRLRALGVPVYCKNFTPYVNGVEIPEDGWIYLNDKSR